MGIWQADVRRLVDSNIASGIVPAVRLGFLMGDWLANILYRMAPNTKLSADSFILQLTQDTSMTNVVAYGTLMFPEVAGPIAQVYAKGEPVTVKGFRRFEATTRERGNYPAIIKEADASFDGLLFRNLSDSQVAKLDWFEDVKAGLYVKKTIQLPLEHEVLNVTVYVCGPLLESKLIKPLKRAWHPELFRRDELALYLDTTVYPAVTSEDYRSQF